MQLIEPLSPDALTPRQQVSYDAKIARDGRVTNMQRTLLHAPEAFDAYIEWYKLRDLLIPAFGERAVWIFCHTISAGTDCLVCSTFFRRLLIDKGIPPEAFVPTEEEQLLQSLARTFLANGHGVDADAWRRLAERHDTRTLVLLIAFGGLMVANNLFNNLLDVPLDEYLYDYRKTA
ncbi:hypothetical protein [Pseudothauera rhizosphaerae]|uniref:Carboxymuconolactone decarboxylase family protein n=1 Tax=Pseudothauera rhizosphaerae TaxID=2565932 RepID=A0A4S4AQW1_9RHOO|nr:hypothetical protein [Pseudothauera rhizosphaerae]THF62124.1 hypothetical protein E6O51_08180 [Pseudothauera rhizosphaerae]